MIIFGLLLGVINIGLGFLVKKHPNLIAGYNTMPEANKKNVDIEKTATIYKNGMIIIGIITIISTTALSILNFNTLAHISSMAPMLIGILILVVITQKYDYNKKSKIKKKAPIIIVSAAIIFVIFILLRGSAQTNVIFNDTNIEFTGQYGITINREQIKKVELIDKLPHIGIRTNGLGLGNILKGHFKVDSLGSCRLFLHLPNPPYLYIELTDGKKIIFNSKTPQYTKNTYNNLKK